MNYEGADAALRAARAQRDLEGATEYLERLLDQRMGKIHQLEEQLEIREIRIMERDEKILRLESEITRLRNLIRELETGFHSVETEAVAMEFMGELL